MKGSLQQKRGKYYAVFRVNGNKNPTWFPLNIDARVGNKRKAEKAMTELIVKYNAQIYTDITFSSYMESWLNSKREIIKPSTFETYEITVNKKILPYFREKGYKLSAISASHFTEYFKFLKLYGGRGGRGLSEKSVKNIKGIISSALEDAVNDNLLSFNPILKSQMPVFEKEIKKEVTTYSAKEVCTLLEYARKSQSHIYIFLLFALNTGLRRGELLALTWYDVDFEKMILNVTKSRTGTKKEVTSMVTKPKTKSSNRVIPLTEFVIDELKEERRRQKQNKQLFGNCYDTGNNFIVRNIDGKPYTNLNAINRVVNRLCKNAGLKHCTIHGFRHTVASLLDDNGVPIQEISVLLGHENVATTEKIYIHRNRTAKRENISLLENVIGYVRQDVRQTQI